MLSGVAPGPAAARGRRARPARPGRPGCPHGRGPRSGAGAADLAAADAALFETLRQWRAGVAKAQGVPAYVVFGDVTLRGIAVDEADHLARQLAAHQRRRSEEARHLRAAGARRRRGSAPDDAAAAAASAAAPGRCRVVHACGAGSVVLRGRSLPVGGTRVEFRHAARRRAARTTRTTRPPRPTRLALTRAAPTARERLDRSPGDRRVTSRTLKRLCSFGRCTRRAAGPNGSLRRGACSCRSVTSGRMSGRRSRRPERVTIVRFSPSKCPRRPVLAHRSVTLGRGCSPSRSIRRERGHFVAMAALDVSLRAHRSPRSSAERVTSAGPAHGVSLRGACSRSRVIPRRGLARLSLNDERPSTCPTSGACPSRASAQGDTLLRREQGVTHRRRTVGGNLLPACRGRHMPSGTLERAHNFLSRSFLAPSSGWYGGPRSSAAATSPGAAPSSLRATISRSSTAS